jgi:WhiB family redox-sensing transcriptional regulator
MGDPNESWMAHGACLGVDPELFFPETGSNAKPAKQVCAVCPVREQCLAFSIREHIHYGVWGGASERDRRIMRRRTPITVAS